jgi:hypothetical protein
VKGSNTVTDGDRHFAEAGFEQIQDAALAAFLTAFLAAFFPAEFFEQGNVGHVFLLLKLLKLFLQLTQTILLQELNSLSQTKQLLIV